MLTLLIVTDNPSTRFWVQTHLKDQFFVLTAERRKEAVEALSSKLDFIIVEESCEGALDLCKELSRLTKRELVPILLITGKLKKSFRNQAAASGVTGFVSDQLDLDEFQTIIQAGLKAAAARQKTTHSATQSLKPRNK